MAEDTSRVGAVRALLNPVSVAIVGANDRPGAWPERIRENLLRFGFMGKIVPINPKREHLWDGPCYASPAELPNPADHLIVLVPAAAAVEAVRLGAKAGSRSATVFSSGLDEAQLEDLREISRETGIAISGPNCLGNVSAAVPLVTTTDSRLDRIEDGSVAIVGQSGGVVTALHRALLGRGVGVRYMVSSGNETVLNTADYIRYFAEDDNVRVVVAFVESLRDPEAFFEAADELDRRGRRLVCLKVGRSPESQSAAASHTGALAGSYEAFEAVASGHGILTVPTLDAALEASELLSRVPAPTGGAVGVVAVSGGVRELALDSASLHGVPLAELGPDTVETIAGVIGAEMEVSNPLDSGYAGLSEPQNLVACVEAMAADPAVGLVLLQEELLGTPAPHKERTLAHFNQAFPGGATRETGVPVSLFSMTSTNVTEFSRTIRRDNPNLAFVQGIDSALALAGTLLRSLPVAGAEAATSAVVGPVRELLAALPSELHEVDAKQIVEAYGIAHPKEALVASPEEVGRWAEANGPGPFVVKAVARGLNHKSETGAVRLDLADGAQARAAAEEIVAAQGDLAGLLVAEQVPGGIELIVGFHHDREVGPVLAVGLGGITVELLGDVQLLRPGCSRTEAEAALRRTAAGTVLDGFRGGPKGDVDAVVDAICALGALAADLGDELASVEINPLVALPPGEGVRALDALCLRHPEVTSGDG